MGGGEGRHHPGAGNVCMRRVLLLPPRMLRVMGLVAVAVDGCVCEGSRRKKVRLLTGAHSKGDHAWACQKRRQQSAHCCSVFMLAHTAEGP